MGIFSFLKRKDARTNHDFSDKDRELAIERRRMNAELENLKKENALREERVRHQIRMAELEEELMDIIGEEEPMMQESMSPETAMVMKLVDKLGTRAVPSSTSPPPPSNVSASSQPTAQLSFTDEELRQKWASTDQKIKATAAYCTDAQVIEYMKYTYGDLDADTCNRAVQMVRKG